MRLFLVTLVKYSALVRALFYKKRFYNLFLLVQAYLSQSEKAGKLPFIVQIEPTTNCNLTCALCLRGLGRLKRRQGNMPYEEFKKIVDQLEATTAYLILYNLGEPLLHPQIYQMVEYAKKKKIFVRLSTNGDFSNKEDIKNLVNCGVDELIISLDCPNSQMYKEYKKSDGFERVVKNAELIIKERGNRLKPFVDLQLLVMRDTEIYISRFKKEAHSLGVDKVLIKSLRINFPGIASDRSFLPKNRKYIRKTYQNILQNGRCYRPWISSVILWDGSVVPCCFDMEGDCTFGNVKNESLKKIWNNEKYILFRKQILEEIRKTPLCKECSLKDIILDFRLIR